MLMIINEAPNDEGFLSGRPLAGAQESLLRQALSHNGVNLKDTMFRSVFPFTVPGIKALCGKAAEGVKSFPPPIKGQYLKAEHGRHLTTLHEAIIHHRPNVILALGATAMWAVTGISGIRNYRGTPMQGIGQLSSFKVIPTFAPSAIHKDWTAYPIFMADIRKAVRNMEYPELRRTRRSLFIEPTFDDLAKFEREHIIPNPQLSIDIETSGRIITCVGFAPTSTVALVVPFVRADNSLYWPNPIMEVGVWKWVKRICALPKTAVFQNGMYDIHHLWRNYGIPCLGAAEGHDTMLLHHALQPEMEKSLRFLGSVYTDEVAWKFMGRKKVETLKAED